MTRGELVALVAWTPAETLAVAEAELAQIKEQMSTRARAWHLGDAPGASSPRRGPQRKAQEAINNA